MQRKHSGWFSYQKCVFADFRLDIYVIGLKALMRKAYLARASFIQNHIVVDTARLSDEHKEKLEIATKKQKMPDANNPKTWQNQPVWGWRYYIDKGNGLISQN